VNLTVLALIALTLATIPAALFLWNLLLVRGPGSPQPGKSPQDQPPVSVLIPARNEVMRIGGALESVLANRDADMEVLVLDDHSTDGTDILVRQFAVRDPRVRLLMAPELPPGWCGKQHACHVLSRYARHDWLVFMDADVRLTPEALQRMTAFIRGSGAALASGVPRQIAGTLSERLFIPLVHFILLGFLPVWRMRQCTKPAYAAGCGQLFIADARAYRQVGGHALIRSSLHDGIKLPRVFRQHGFHTDLFDATDVAECRMYQGFREVLAGLMKNAHEALASPAMILPMTFMLLGGQVLPWVLLIGWSGLSIENRWMVSVAAGLTLLPRLLAAWKFRQSPSGALMHPLTLFMFVVIQWAAFVRAFSGKPAQWRGREYEVAPGNDRASGRGKRPTARPGVAL